jgi:hypothetical protein
MYCCVLFFLDTLESIANNFFKVYIIYMANEYFINGVQKYTNTTNANYMTISSDTIDANGTVITPKYLSAMVSNTVNPTNLNLVNAMSVASATTSPAYTINLQSAPAGVGSLWGIDYETTTAEDLQITTSSATAGVNFNTVGGTTSSRIKNGTITSTSSTNVNTITPNQLEITDTGNILKKSTFGISQWIMRNGAFALTQYDPTEINITNGDDTARVSTTTIGTSNSTSGLVSSMGVGIMLNTLSNMGTRITNAGIDLGYNTTTSNSSITMTNTNVTDGTNTKTWANILTGATYLSRAVTSQAVQTTRRSFCSINSGAVIPAGTWIVSATVVIPTTTTNLQFSITGSLSAPVTDGTTPAGTAYAYGGNIVNATSTTAPYTVSLSTVIVFDGTKVCSVGLATTPAQTITSIALQAVRIG